MVSGFSGFPLGCACSVAEQISAGKGGDSLEKRFRMNLFSGVAADGQIVN